MKKEEKIPAEFILYCEICWEKEFDSRTLVERAGIICKDCSDNKD